MIVTVLLIAIVVLTVYVGSHRLSGSTTAAVLAIAMFGIAMVVFPNATSALATFVGVGRGTDLLLYFGVVAGLFVTAHFYFRTKSLEARLATLARAVALSDALRERELESAEAARARRSRAG